MVEVIKSCIGTKFMGQYADLACSIALRAVKTITTEDDGRREIDVKKWARIEKVWFYAFHSVVIFDVFFFKDKILRGTV